MYIPISRKRFEAYPHRDELAGSPLPGQAYRVDDRTLAMPHFRHPHDQVPYMWEPLSYSVEEEDVPIFTQLSVAERKATFDQAYPGWWATIVSMQMDHPQKKEPG